MNKVHLAVRNLTITFSQLTQPVIESLSFDLRYGQCIGLVGESGSGKSLTSLAILQLLPTTARIAQSSQILLGDQEDLLNLSERNMRKVRGLKIGMIFQDAMSALNPVLTISQQLCEIIRKRRKISSTKLLVRASELLREVGIEFVERCLESYPHQLSGGMRQRAMIAMALAGEPDLLIADEPTTALDVTIQAQVLKLLAKLNRERGMTLLFISHDLALVAQVADEIIVLKKGQKIEQQSAETFFIKPRELYSQKLLKSVLPIEIPFLSARKLTSVGEGQDGGIENKVLFEVKNLKVYFALPRKWLHRRKYIKAVDNVSFSLTAGQTFALIGESGSGKTTIAKAILKLIPAECLQMKFANIDLTHISAHALRELRANLQIIFQDPYAALNPRLMILDSIAEGLIAQRKVKSRQQMITMVDRLLTQVEMPLQAKWRYPHEFSGGERQRLCIARALALEPKLLILDEPTSALDASTQMQILNLLIELQKKEGLTYLLITHNMSVVAYMAHHVAVMYHGKIIEQGDTAEILQNPQHAYTQQLLAAVPRLPYLDNGGDNGKKSREIEKI